MVWEAFKVYGGQSHAVEAFMKKHAGRHAVRLDVKQVSAASVFSIFCAISSRSTVLQLVKLEDL